MSDAMLALGQATLAAQPFSVLMGAELAAFAEGQVGGAGAAATRNSSGNMNH